MWTTLTISSLSTLLIGWQIRRRRNHRTTFHPTPDPTKASLAMREATIHAGEANAHAREIVRTGNTDWNRLCLKFVRTCWGLPAVHPTAAIAWEKAEDKHTFTRQRDIPYGAPVFTRRPDAGPDDSGHILLAGGYNRHGVRIFRSTDIKIHGGISACTLDDIRERWGHEILGWTGDLNGYDLNLPPAGKR